MATAKGRSVAAAKILDAMTHGYEKGVTAMAEALMAGPLKTDILATMNANIMKYISLFQNMVSMGIIGRGDLTGFTNLLREFDKLQPPGMLRQR